MTITALQTRDYSRAFEVDREKSLATRFAAYCLTVIGTVVLLRLVSYGAEWMAEQLPSNDPKPSTSIAAVSFLVAALRILLYAGGLVLTRVRSFERREILRLAVWLLVVSVSMQLLANLYAMWAAPSEGDSPSSGTAILLGMQGALAILAAHFFACLFLPWKPMESLKPVVPLLVLNAVITLAFGYRTPWYALATVLTFPAAALPGVAVCAWRFSRYREKFALERLRGQYREISRELIDARRLHESLFPSPVHAGPVRFTYLYEPMRQIGGDYLFARELFDEQGLKAFNLVLMDVTGHGIAAALTVNRLYGEIERLYAENPNSDPGEVLTALNRYVHLTLARHSVYVTTVCVRIDPRRNTLEYASGGHPPAFLAGVDGTIEELESTSFVLGACAGADFEPCTQTRPFGPGDTLIAYTDGAIEARPESGRMMGVEGLRRVLKTASISGGHMHGYAEPILRAVEQHRLGPPEDDTLIVEIRRPIEVQPESATPGFRPLHAPGPRAPVHAG